MEADQDQWRIRRAHLEDVKEMEICAKAAYRHYVTRIGKPPGPMLDDYAKLVEQHQAFVAEESGRVVGVLVLILKNDGILMDNVAGLPEYQGQGLGHQLIQFAEAHAFERGYKNLDIYTHELMTENIEMYRRLGYFETERRTEKGYRRVYMSKRLR